MTTKTLPEVPVGMQRIYRRFERWRKSHRGRLPIPEALWAAAAELAREHGVFRTAKTLGLEHSKLKGMVKVKSTKPAVRRAPTPPGGGLLGVGGTAALCARSDGVRHRVGRAARQGAHPVERVHGTGSRWAEPVIVGVGVIQITPQMRASWLRSNRSMAGRASIRSPGCARTNSGQIPSRDACLYSGAVAGPRSVSWSMTAKGSGWRRNGCRRGDSCGGRAAKSLPGWVAVVNQVPFSCQDSLLCIREIPGDLAHPQSVRHLRDARDLQLPRRQVDEEQNDKPPQPSPGPHLHGEEIRGHDQLPMPAQKQIGRASFRE